MVIFNNYSVTVFDNSLRLIKLDLYSIILIRGTFILELINGSKIRHKQYLQI
jgi:hypothetical protein